MIKNFFLVLLLLITFSFQFKKNFKKKDYFGLDEFLEFSDSEVEETVPQLKFWETFKTQLFDTFKQGGNTQGLQLLESAIVANWDSKPETLSNFCNEMSEWGVLYKAKPKITFNDQYYNFLKNLKMEPTNKADYEAKMKRLAEAEEEVKKRTIECEKAYKESDQKISFEEFKKSEDCFLLSNAVTNKFFKQGEVDRITQQSKKDEEVAEGKTMYEKTKVYSWDESSTSKNLKNFKNDIQNNERLSKLSISVTKSSTQNIRTNEQWKFKESKESFIINENIQKQNEFSTSFEYFKLNIDIQGYYSIDVAPNSSWFKNIIDQNKNRKLLNVENYFGENGTFNLMKQKVYLVYKPTISFQLNKEDTLLFKTMKEKKTIIKIGPFRMMIDNVPEILKLEKEEEKMLRTSYKIDLVSVENEPLIIAVENQIL